MGMSTCSPGVQRGDGGCESLPESVEVVPEPQGRTKWYLLPDPRRYRGMEVRT